MDNKITINPMCTFNIMLWHGYDSQGDLRLPQFLDTPLELWAYTCGYTRGGVLIKDHSLKKMREHVLCVNHEKSSILVSFIRCMELEW